jgi:cilia- and flagella-associated protein 52
VIILTPNTGSTIQNAVAISNNGKWIATAGADSVVRLWSYETGECIAEARAHSAPVVSLAFSPNHAFLVSVGSEAAIMSWQLPN